MGFGDDVEEPQKPMVMKSTAWAARLCDYVERAILWYFDDYSSKKPNYWIKGNYAPADETDPASNLPVVGAIPVSIQFSLFCAFYHLGNGNVSSCAIVYFPQECLNGEFVRVGTNPKFEPIASYHW
jgi:hypothetical protein